MGERRWLKKNWLAKREEARAAGTLSRWKASMFESYFAKYGPTKDEIDLVENEAKAQKAWQQRRRSVSESVMFSKPR